MKQAMTKRYKDFNEKLVEFFEHNGFDVEGRYHDDVWVIKKKSRIAEDKAKAVKNSKWMGIASLTVALMFGIFTVCTWFYAPLHFKNMAYFLGLVTLIYLIIGGLNLKAFLKNKETSIAEKSYY